MRLVVRLATGGLCLAVLLLSLGSVSLHDGLDLISSSSPPASGGISPFSKHLLRTPHPSSYYDPERLAYQSASPATWDLLYRHAIAQHARADPVGRSFDQSVERKLFFQRYWEPSFSCDFPLRVGKIGNGGYWLCNPASLLASAKTKNRKILVYSFGHVKGDVFFSLLFF